ncbi:hypothetical protein ACO2Q7_03840 [Rathayibacter sp. KR2-224]|uniref:hypothetical protein n=1 Tax=Rathayibacter sp. KR2-224 TaxID=3400913 RepID=UPI003BFFCEC2
MVDQQFHDAVVHAALERVRELVADSRSTEAKDVSHRQLMCDAKVLLSAVAAGELGAQERARALESAAARIDILRSLQADSGLFTGGDNLQSPPDSAFTINDACDTYEFLGAYQDDESIAGLRSRLAAIIRDSSDALRRGGVHTPNHRWEISAALARIHRSFPDSRLLQRVDEWLAEGVDVDRDGLYSERSPNYAVFVSNPSLTVLAQVLGRPDLRAVVIRNLEATLSLLRPDDTVETVQSRRQDQAAHFSLKPYLAAFRAAAVETGRADFALAARLAASAGVRDPELLAETLLHPALLEPLPQSSDASLAGSYFFADVSLAGRRSPSCESVLYGGSDYSAARRIRSGLANNPTFCRFFAGDAVLDSIRLSREFFDLGPFRASAMRRVAENRYELEEVVEAAYYQPLPSGSRRADGRYDLADDGRFSASMSFPLRPHDVLTMSTKVRATLLSDGIDLEFQIDAPATAWALEFGFRDGGTVEDGVRDDDGSWVLPDGRGTYRTGDSGIAIEVEGAPTSRHPLTYQPGQDYGFLGATDAVGGVRLRVGGTTPAAFAVRIRSDREDAR